MNLRDEQENARQHQFAALVEVVAPEIRAFLHSRLQRLYEDGYRFLAAEPSTKRRAARRKDKFSAIVGTSHFECDVSLALSVEKSGGREGVELIMRAILAPPGSHGST